MRDQPDDSAPGRMVPRVGHRVLLGPSPAAIKASLARDEKPQRVRERPPQSLDGLVRGPVLQAVPEDGQTVKELPNQLRIVVVYCVVERRGEKPKLLQIELST